MLVDLVYGSPPEADAVEPVEYVQKVMELLQDTNALVRQNLGVAARRRNRRYDINVRVKEFNAGMKSSFLANEEENIQNWPFIVLERTGPLNYRVQKKPRGKISVTHVDKLSPVAVLKIAKKMSRSQ